MRVQHYQQSISQQAVAEKMNARPVTAMEQLLSKLRDAADRLGAASSRLDGVLDRALGSRPQDGTSGNQQPVPVPVPSGGVGNLHVIAEQLTAIADGLHARLDTLDSVI